MIPVRASFALIALLLFLRAVMAAMLPLSADEAYYWLWSRHLAAGYFDHPPAIAWLIRAGTLLLGDTPAGVRMMGVLLSLPANWLVWRSARLLLKDEGQSALAALFFNLTLMISVEMLAATPDMPSIVTSAAFLFFLCKAQRSGNGRWWLAAGAAAGLGLLSKYSALFLGLATLVWLVSDRRQRRWLATPWPWLGGLIALAVFSPNLVWQAQHQWETFRFQFGRVGGGQLTLRFLGEFLAAQFGLASPVIFVLMAWGLARATRPGDARLLPAVMAWTGIAYFLEHALHDRVQGNWPCFLYPALSILAAGTIPSQGWPRRLALCAAPVAGLLLLLAYAQAGFGIVPLKKDPAARILGRDFAPIGDVAAALVRSGLADAVLTSDYETTAWLRFNHPTLKVVQVNEPWRYPQAPPATGLTHPVYLTELRRDQHLLVQRIFAYVGFPTQMQTPSSLYMLYPLRGARTAAVGRMP